jgi:signal transduction histidine kinase
MKNKYKTKVQLISELERLQQQLSELKTLGDKCKPLEADLSQQNEFFHHVLESLTHPFYVLDAHDYTIKVANSASRLGTLVAKPTCYALTHKRDAPCDGLEHVCPLQVVKKTKEPVTIEHIHYDKDGNARNFEVHAYPIFDQAGNVVQMIEYSLDITDRKRMEKEIQDYHEKIKLFAYSISHDLKNPLIAINGLTKLIDKHYGDRFDDKWREVCGQIIKESDQALALIEEINVFIKTKETPLNFEQLDSKEIIGQVREEFWTAIASRHINWSEPEYIPKVKADKLSLLRVFRNLVDNALKHGGNDLREIKIGYEESEPYHLFSVSDDGSNIDKEHFEKIFGRFQRRSTAGRPEGLGLGLAIVKEIAEKHGGRAWVERRPEKGVTLYISLAKNL